jgi:hypothetical protein
LPIRVYRLHPPPPSPTLFAVLLKASRILVLLPIRVYRLHPPPPSLRPSSLCY